MRKKNIVKSIFAFTEPYTTQNRINRDFKADTGYQSEKQKE